MSEKISINVEILGINTIHNYLVPNDMSVAKITNLILKTLSDEYPGTKCDKLRTHLLIQESSGKVLTQDCGLRQLGLVNGEKVILI